MVSCLPSSCAQNRAAMNKYDESLFKNWITGRYDWSRAPLWSSFESDTSVLSARRQTALDTCKLALALPPEGRMKFLSCGSCWVMSSVHFSSVSKWLVSHFTRSKTCSDRADDSGVATKDCKSWITHWIASNCWFTSESWTNSRESPMWEDNSSVEPRTSKMTSSFGRRSPVYRAEVPLSPVLV